MAPLQITEFISPVNMNKKKNAAVKNSGKIIVVNGYISEKKKISLPLPAHRIPSCAIRSAHRHCPQAFQGVFAS